MATEHSSKVYKKAKYKFTPMKVRLFLLQIVHVKKNGAAFQTKLFLCF